MLYALCYMYLLTPRVTTKMSYISLLPFSLPLSLYRVCCAGCSGYYRHALVYVPGGASMLALVGLAILTVIIYWKSRQCSGRCYYNIASSWYCYYY